jgi:hypothetical protein
MGLVEAKKMADNYWRNTDNVEDCELDNGNNRHNEPEVKPFGNMAEKRVAELYSRIKPVLRFKENRKDGKLEHVDYNGDLYYLQEQGHGKDWLYRTAYTWDPQAAGKAEGLEKLCEMPMKHSWAYYGFFKPSINEVMEQIPAQYLDEVVAFETLSDTAAITGDYHTATTVLYRGKDGYSPGGAGGRNRSASSRNNERRDDNDIWRNTDS